MAISLNSVGPALRTIFTTGASSITYAHTVAAGTDRLMLVGVVIDDGATGDRLTSVTYPVGGVPTAMTLIGKRAISAAYVYLLYLANPDVGTANVVTTESGEFYMSVGSVVYNGASPEQPDAYEHFAGNGEYQLAATTTRPNCWLAMFGLQGGSSANTAGAGAVKRVDMGFNAGQGGNCGMFDSDGPHATADYHILAMTSRGGGVYGAMLLASLYPTVADVEPTESLSMFLAL